MLWLQFKTFSKQTLSSKESDKQSQEKLETTYSCIQIPVLGYSFYMSTQEGIRTSQFINTTYEEHPLSVSYTNCILIK